MRQEPLRRLCVVENGRQRLAQLMGESTGQFAERGHAGQVREQLSLLLKLQLGLFALGDVDHHGSQLAPPIGPAGHDPYHVVHPQHAAVGRQHPVLHDVVVAVGRRLCAQRHGQFGSSG